MGLLDTSSIWWPTWHNEDYSSVYIRTYFTSTMMLITKTLSNAVHYWKKTSGINIRKKYDLICKLLQNYTYYQETNRRTPHPHDEDKIKLTYSVTDLSEAISLDMNFVMKILQIGYIYHDISMIQNSVIWQLHIPFLSQFPLILSPRAIQEESFYHYHA